MIYQNDSMVRKDFQNDSSCLGSLPPSDDDQPVGRKTDDILEDITLVSVERESEENHSHDLDLDTQQSGDPRGSVLIVPGYDN